MKEFETKEIAQIRFEFTDGTWFIFDHQTMRHLKPETKLEVDFALSKACDEIETAREIAEKTQGGKDFNIETQENINTKDKLV